MFQSCGDIIKTHRKRQEIAISITKKLKTYFPMFNKYSRTSLRK